MPIKPDLNLFARLHYKMQDACQCGRGTKSIHCPDCGSGDVNVRSRIPKSEQVHDENNIPCREFKCRKCKFPFPERDCFRACQALPLPVLTKKTEELSKVVREMTPQGKALLEELYRKRPELRPREQEPERERTALEIADEERKRIKETTS